VRPHLEFAFSQLVPQRTALGFFEDGFEEGFGDAGFAAGFAAGLGDSLGGVGLGAAEVCADAPSAKLVLACQLFA